MMKDSIRVIGRTRRVRWRGARALAAITAAAGLVVPVAAASSQSTNTQKALAFSRCMRAHGVRKFPDPYSSGVIPKVSLQQLGVSNSQFQAAEKACQNLLPPGGSDDQFPPGETQQLLIGMLRFSRCMRSHGLPNWPDPAVDAAGQPEFPVSTTHGINPHPRLNLPPFATPARKCRPVMPSALQGVPLG